MARAEKRKYHYIYKTTCGVTNKFYIGMHSTDSLEDGYVGSGKHLWYSIRKHGKENHSTEILEFLSSREELKLREAQLVNEELLSEKLCMNLKLGGEGGGGFDHISPELRKLNSAKGGRVAMASRKQTMAARSEESKAKIKASKLAKYGNAFGCINQEKHSIETKQKISDSMIGKQDGELNSQYGSCWIYNSEEKTNRKISKSELYVWTSHGWIKGRKMFQ